MAIPRFADTDDDGSRTVGTVRNNAWLTRVWDAVDARWNSITISSTGVGSNISLVTSSLEADVVYFSNASLLAVTGFLAPASPVKPWKELFVISQGVGQVDFNPESGSSTAANRILTPGGVNTSLAAGYGVGILRYDSVNSRWRLVVHDQGAPIPYTSTWGSIGSANTTTGSTLTSFYYLEGKRCWYRIKLLWGVGTAAGTLGATFTLPFVSDASGVEAGGSVVCFDTSASASYQGAILTSSTSVLIPTVPGITTTVGTAVGPLAVITGTYPFTWTSGDYMTIKGWFWLN